MLSVSDSSRPCATVERGAFNLYTLMHIFTQFNCQLRCSCLESFFNTILCISRIKLTPNKRYRNKIRISYRKNEHSKATKN
jgi:hypothetical protein